MGNGLSKLIGVLGITSVLASGCGSKAGGGSNIPLVTPPVKAATPAGLKGTSNALTQSALTTFKGSPFNGLLSASDFKDRFFSTGPTDILDNLLPALDKLIGDVNTQIASGSSPCLSQAPVQYVINPFGQDVAMYAQCYNQLTPSYSGDPAFIQFGVQNGATYVYAAYGAEWEAAILTPISGSSGQYSVQAWIGLGYANVPGCSSTWDGCSYAGMELQANPSTHTFELAVAGMGIGYCGAQLKSDGTNLWAEGSSDMGTTCQATDTLCVLATDTTQTGTCNASLTTFALSPIGRKSAPSTASMVVGTWAASNYPSTPNVLFDGTSSDAIHFGPTSPTAGVGKLQSK